jgi:hypothetical protein
VVCRGEEGGKERIWAMGSVEAPLARRILFFCVDVSGQFW